MVNLFTLTPSQIFVCAEIVGGVFQGNGLLNGGHLNLSPDSTLYELCDLVNILNLSELHYFHPQNEIFTS